jgi:hypothetical protein
MEVAGVDARRVFLSACPERLLGAAPMMRQATKKRFASVWDAIEDTPKKAGSDLMRGKIDVFGLDALVNMAAAGLSVKLRVRNAV